MLEGDERKIVFIFFIKRINEIVQNSPPFPSIKFHQLNFIPVHSIIVKNSPTNYTRGGKTRNFTPIREDYPDRGPKSGERGLRATLSERSSGLEGARLSARMNLIV